MAGKTKTAASKINFDWKIIAGVIVILALVGFIGYQIFNFVSVHTSSNYEKAISSYYQALASADTNTIQQVTAPDFQNDLVNLALKPGKYQLFEYQFEDLSNSATNNEISNVNAKILYSISTTEEKSRVSYLAEAYFTLNNNAVKIMAVKKLNKGKDITR